MTDFILGSITMQQQLTSEANLRVKKYEAIEYLNQVTNSIITVMSSCEDKTALYGMLEDLKRAKELVNNF